jgi:hypothetical protein
METNKECSFCKKDINIKKEKLTDMQWYYETYMKPQMIDKAICLYCYNKLFDDLKIRFKRKKDIKK